MVETVDDAKEARRRALARARSRKAYAKAREKAKAAKAERVANDPSRRRGFGDAHTDDEVDAIVSAVCEQMAQGVPMTRALKAPGMPSVGTWCKWCAERSSVGERYARAREALADHYADDVQNISDALIAGDIDHNQARVLVDARKWQARVTNPAKYSDRIDVTGAAAGSVTVQVGYVIDTREPLALPPAVQAALEPPPVVIDVDSE
jgi:hypothetical protein